jgi:hypothetical protein
MQAYRQLPPVKVIPETAIMTRGLDLISPPGYAPPGTCRFSQNYEQEFGGGYRRVGGFERYDGHPSPHLAAYVALEAEAGFTGLAVGDAVEGSVSTAEGVVAYLTDTLVVLTKIVGVWLEDEDVMLGATNCGTITSLEPTVDGFLDNELLEACANIYRADIAGPGGSDPPIRGVAVLNNVVYCWQDDAGALKLYKATATGWVLVPYYHEVAFTAGSAAYADGSTITQGGNSATVKRAVLESGDWSAGTAAGRLIVDPVAGTLAAGAAAGSGACTLGGAPAQITCGPLARVQTVVYNFTASLNTRRLYGCDGVNREFEFDGEVYVPLNTGMGNVRAVAVACHKNHLFYLYNGSLQHSGIGRPYAWSPLVGAGELGTGDVGTNLTTVSGSEASAALMVQCQDSTWVLYGTSAADWQFQRISEEGGAQQYSAQAFDGAPMAFDQESFTRYAPTDTYGNFSFNSISRAVDPLLRGARVKASVLVKNRSMYRCFFADGLFITATYMGKDGWSWMPCKYGITIECAVGAEINGQYRNFVGGFDGKVYETDVGRSFDGNEVEAYLRMSSQTQRANVTLKQYRNVEFDTVAESAFELSVGAEFSDSDPQPSQATPTSARAYGAGLFWNFSNWDRAYWDVALANRIRYSIQGHGRSVSIMVQSVSTNEMPHTIKSMTTLYTPRRLAR